MYKANEQVKIENVQVWLTTWNSLTFAIAPKGERSHYYTKEGYLFLAEFPLDFAVRADYNETADKIGALEAKKAEVTKEFQETIGKLTAEITKLQAIEMVQGVEVTEIEPEVIDVEDKAWFYFTFPAGTQHTHSNGYTKAYGTYGSARAQMVKAFGTDWAFQYNEEQFGDQASEYGLHFVPMPEEDDDIPF